MAPSTVSVHVGVDVGGTYTDAVVMTLAQASQREVVVSSAKRATTADVTAGVCRAIGTALDRAVKTLQPGEELRVQRVHIGTTHFVNAVVQRRGLAQVAALRLCGPATVTLPPFVDFPPDLKDVICGTVELHDGGYEFDGKNEIRPVQEAQIKGAITRLKEKNLTSVVITGVFSPVNVQQEEQVEAIFSEHYPEASLTLSHRMGQLGLLERENAAILNESLKPLCRRTVAALRSALDQLGLACPIYLTQNDGTVISSENALEIPIVTFASGPTNSMRGAAFLTGDTTSEFVVVVDIGGTTTDVGVLLKGFPREAQMKIKVGGVRTNFRMPDVLTIGLGGGSLVTPHTEEGRVHVTVGPQSTGYRLTTDGLVFGGDTLTASDVAVAANVATMGEPHRVAHLSQELVTATMDVVRQKVEECIDQVKTSKEDTPVVLVGGGSALIQSDLPLKGTSTVLKPKHYEVANAVGAALSQVSGSEDVVRDLSTMSREEAMDMAVQKAKERAIQAGADPDTIEITEKQDIQLTYLPGNATHIKVKAVGDLLWTDDVTHAAKWTEGAHIDLKCSSEEEGVLQVSSSTGTSLGENDITIQETPPVIDQSTGEWVLSEWDVMCLSVGTTILGCGGGGNPYTPTLRALQLLRHGKRISIVKADKCAAGMGGDDCVVNIAFMGAPIVLSEKLINGTEYRYTVQSMHDLYSIGRYADGKLHNTAGVDVKHKDGVTYIDDYRPEKSPTAEQSQSIPGKNVIAVTGAEIGGMNGIEPLCMGAHMKLPVVDCDTMGRAFPELQQTSILMYGRNPYPAFLANVDGKRPVVLYAESPKHLENHFRGVCVELGCINPFMFDAFGRKDIAERTVHLSYSRAWHIGRAVLKARQQKVSPITAIVEHAGGKLVSTGKIGDVIRQTTGGFTRGKIIVVELGENTGSNLEVHFQNEFLLCKRIGSKTLACTPDLISVVEMDSGQPITVDELRYGLRVAILALPVPPMMSTPEALKVVGPQAFGYSEEEAVYTPVGPYEVEAYPWMIQ